MMEGLEELINELDEETPDDMDEYESTEGLLRELGILIDEYEE